MLLRPVNAALSMFVAWLRVAFSALGLAILMNLVTAHRLVAKATALRALGQGNLDAQVYVAITAFNSQFAFSLVFFGVYLVMLGWLVYRSGYMPRWLGALLALDGAIWVVMNAGPYLLPGANFGWLFVVTFVELLLPIWLIARGRRLTADPSAMRV